MIVIGASTHLAPFEIFVLDFPLSALLELSESPRDPLDLGVKPSVILVVRVELVLVSSPLFGAAYRRVVPGNTKKKIISSVSKK